MAAPAQTPVTQPVHTDPDVIARLGAKARKWKEQTRAAQEERDRLKADLEAAQAQIKDLAGRADGNEAARQRDELAAKLRTIEHRKVFDEAAKAAGAATEAQRNDLFERYKVEGDVPDPAKIGELIEAQKAERPYLFGGASPEPPAPRPAAGAGRGSSDRENQGLFVVSRAQANDPLFMRDNANKIWQAQQEGRFKLADVLPER